MSSHAICVAGLSKQYFIGAAQQQHDRLGEQLADALMQPLKRAAGLLRGQAYSAANLQQPFWALKDVSFEVRRGEVVGVIGRNGAGKSTLLKILSRITEPTAGYADLYGRVGSLLEVGTGFHPELTGRENIYLNGAILGMGRREIARKLPEIVEFAEIGQFIDTPVKHYSSGMYVRLAFAIAAHLEPEILVVDEVLAVGDLEFQRKCLGKMDDVSKQGRTVLFVSHNMGLMQTLCQRGIFLNQGTIHTDARIGQAVDAYLQTLEQTRTQDLATRADRRGLGKSRLLAVEISNGTSPNLKSGCPARLDFHVNRLLPGMHCTCAIYDHLGMPVTVFKSRLAGPDDRRDTSSGLKFVCEVEQLLLLPGRYRIDVSLTGDNRVQDHIEAATFFDVAQGTIAGRVAEPASRFSMVMPHRWTVPLD
jgi:lipopolysaccharide transport system ATP-binding protein